MHDLNYTALGFLCEDGNPEWYTIRIFNFTSISSREIHPPPHQKKKNTVDQGKLSFLGLLYSGRTTIMAES